MAVKQIRANHDKTCNRIIELEWVRNTAISVHVVSLSLSHLPPLVAALMAASRTLFSKGSKVLSGLATVAAEVAGAAEAICSDALTDGDDEDEDEDEEDEENEKNAAAAAVSVVINLDDDDDDDDETLRSHASIH